MIKIDGIRWDVPCSVERAAEMTSSEISGLMLDKTYFNDVIGTFMSYDVSMAIPTNMMSDYAAIYEALTSPVDGHSLILPYNQTTIEITARIQSVTDTLVWSANDRRYWKGVKFTAVANHPSKAMSLGDVLSRGLSPLPAEVGIPVGAVYEMGENGWQVASFTDGDEVFY